MIISKWTIYLISILGKIGWSIDFSLAFFLVSVPLALLFNMACKIEGLDDYLIEKHPKIIKIYVISMVITILLNIIIPSEKTMYLMLISDYVTTDNMLITKEILITTIQEISEVLK